MLDPDEVASRLPQWMRVLLVGVLVILVSGAGLFAYRYYTTPKIMTIAAGSVDGEAARMMSAIAVRLSKSRSQIRFRVVDTGNMLESAKTFSEGKADLAIVRADIGDLQSARTVVEITNGVVMIIVPHGVPITSMDGLHGKTVGVLELDINRHIVEILTKEYDLARHKVQFKDIAAADVPQALRTRQISALMVVTSISEKHLSVIRGFFPSNAKRAPSLIAIESAGAIANVAQAYESFELPKGTLRGTPPVPDEDLTTLRVPYYLVANKKLDKDQVTDLTSAIMDARRDLVAEYPLLSQIAAPDTDKDAYIPIHPGAAAFFDDSQQTFLEKYSDALFYVPVLLGGLASILVAAWNFLGFGSEGTVKNPLQPLYELAGPIRDARNEAELASIEEEIDHIIKAELGRKLEKEENPAVNSAALSLAAQRLEHLIEYRRAALRAGAT